MPRVSRSILTCICTAVVCAASTVAFADTGRTVAINVTDMNGVPSADASVAVQTIDGVMTEATSAGSVYAVKNVGRKVTIEVVHPVYGRATIDAVLPMVDPIQVEVTFTGPNRAFLSQLDNAELGAIQDRAPGPWNQDPGIATPEGGGGSCASCAPIGEGVFAGNSCGSPEADITSCTFADTETAWYCYTASCDGDATATTCGSGFDTALSVWSSCGGSELACNDDDCGLQSTITWAASAGATYYIRVSGFNGQCGTFTLDVSCSGGGGGGCGNCNTPHGGLGCSDPTCQAIVCAADPFCCDVAWDGICAGEAEDLCNCSGPGCQSDDDCPAGQVCIGGACVAPPCDIECPAGALEEGEPCGDDNNGGCNSVPPAFTEANCGDTYCGTGWADGGTRDTDWYLVDHGGGVLSASLNSQFQGVLFIVDGIGACAPAVVGDIGCANDCSPIADASADLPAGQYVVFVSVGDCAGGGIFEGTPCGTGDNDYVVSITCEGLVTGACCLPDNTCVDGVTQSECEDPPSSGDCGNCNTPHGGLGCSDPVCEAIVCAVDPFCCATAWDGICAGEAEDLCDCGSGPGGLGGVYQGDDTVCPGPTCIPVGGCCQCDEDLQFCTIESEDDCAALGGAYLGDEAACEAGGGQVTVSSNPNAAIPDNDLFGVSDTINMGSSFTVLDLEVQVNISHTWVGDLCVQLSKDGGPEVTLIQRMDDAVLGCDGGCCGCSANNFNVTLDDEAGSSIDNQCQDNLVGTFTPDPGSLAGFVGGDSAGAWTIRVNDNAGADLGTLVSWGLTFTQPASGGSPCEDAFPDQCVTAIEGSLDIKPGSCPNSFNRNSNGVLPVALVGSEEIDAGSVDLSSLALSRADGVGGSASPNEGPPGPNIEIGDTATAFFGETCDCHELGGDGIDDVNVKFRSQDVVDALELNDLPSGALVELVLTGSLLDGTEFSASDCIRLVPPGTPPGVLLVGSNLPGVWVDVTPLDDALDTGGYVSFNRSYPQTTVVTVTAPLSPIGHPDWELVGVWVDGVSYAAGNGIITLAIDGDQNMVALQYRNISFFPNHSIGERNNSGPAVGH